MLVSVIGNNISSRLVLNPRRVIEDHERPMLHACFMPRMSPEAL